MGGKCGDVTRVLCLTGIGPFCRLRLMPRRARIVIPDCPHHVTQRGNRREDVFFTDADRRRHLELLKAYADEHARGRIA